VFSAEAWKDASEWLSRNDGACRGFSGMLFRQQPQDAGCGEQHIIDEESWPGVGGIRCQKMMLRGFAVCFSHGVFQQPAHDENRARNDKMTLSWASKAFEQGLGVRGSL
jgi:hypothetical protein